MAKRRNALNFPQHHKRPAFYSSAQPTGKPAIPFLSAATRHFIQKSPVVSYHIFPLSDPVENFMRICIPGDGVSMNHSNRNSAESLFTPPSIFPLAPKIKHLKPATLRPVLYQIPSSLSSPQNALATPVPNTLYNSRGVNNAVGKIADSPPNKGPRPY